MTTNEDTRCSILSAAKALLREAYVIEKITVRQIATRAGVGAGLINYYFESKDDLLNAAINDFTVEAMIAYADKASAIDMEPVDRLKAFLGHLLELADGKADFVRFIFSQNILKVSMQAPLRIIPLLRDVFGEEKDDVQLRVMALQILYPLQAAGLELGIFHVYSGWDLRDPEHRKRYVDMLIDNIICQNKIK